MRDEQGVQNLTSLPRSRWAKIRATMETNPVNRRSLHTIDSAFSFVVLEDSSPEESVRKEMNEIISGLPLITLFFDRTSLLRRGPCSMETDSAGGLTSPSA